MYYPSAYPYYYAPIEITAFGNEEISIHWKFVLRSGFDSNHGLPLLESLNWLLKKEGFRSPEDLRKVFDIPQKRLAVRVVKTRDESEPGRTPMEVLRAALIVGLCGPAYYDPARPVVWTEKTLWRSVELYEPGDFYGTD